MRLGFQPADRKMRRVIPSLPSARSMRMNPRQTDHSQAQPQRPSTTFFESFDGWAQLLRQTESQPAAAGQQPAISGPPEAESFRPVVRQPMALLHVIDDGCDEGETIRLRGDRLSIGRSEGDVLIPHDISMAPSHARIDRIPEGGWLLTDLQSGDDRGTFVRVLTAKLRHGSVLQVGMTRLRFELVDPSTPRLVELSGPRIVRQHDCHAPHSTIGRAGCGARVAIDDAFVSPLHADLHQTPKGWRIENRGLNGLWVRIDAPVKRGGPSQFQCGEQRFVFVPLAG